MRPLLQLSDYIDLLERKQIELETVINEYLKTLKYKPTNDIELRATKHKIDIIKMEAAKRIKDMELIMNKLSRLIGNEY